MTKTNSKKALLSSAFALVLSAAMLIGTTFAWFTDTASTGVNKIQAGNLDIELQMKDNNGKWVNAEGKTLSFLVNGKIPAEGTQILWEPGCTYTLPELRIVNNGNLALKYKVVVSGIQGSAKLNKVINWTMKLDDADFIMGSEHSLAAKNNDTVDFDIFTVSGTMDTSIRMNPLTVSVSMFTQRRTPWRTTASAMITIKMQTASLNSIHGMTM